MIYYYYFRFGLVWLESIPPEINKYLKKEDFKFIQSVPHVEAQHFYKNKIPSTLDQFMRDQAQIFIGYSQLLNPLEPPVTEIEDISIDDDPESCAIDGIEPTMDHRFGEVEEPKEAFKSASMPPINRRIVRLDDDDVTVSLDDFLEGTEQL